MEHVKRSARAEAEGAALAAARHPGVVELVGVDGDTVRTVVVEGARPLPALGPLTADEIAGLLASLATTVADLHDRGVVHGGLEAAHVLVCPDGRPVLCSLGRGGRAADDVAALGRLAQGLLAGARPVRPRPAPAAGGPGPRRRPPALGPMLAPAAEPVLAGLVAQATAADPAARPRARDLAAAVHRELSTARLPVPGPARLALGQLRAPPAGPGGASVAGRRPTRRRPAGARRARPAVLALAVAAAAGAGALVLVVGDAPAGVPAKPAPATRPSVAAARRPGSTTTAPVAVAVWPRAPVEFHGGVLTVDAVRYEVGRPGDEVVLGDWSCTGRRTAALLRPETGEVFAFDDWPAGADEAVARPLGQVDGGRRLRAVDHDGDGCEELEVARLAGSPVTLRARP